MNDRCDVIIAGGGVIGSSIAYNLLVDGFEGRVIVIERDPKYEFSSTPRSVGGIRQVFSSEVNIRMSQYGLEVFRRFPDDMAVDGEQAFIDYKERGYLFLLNGPMMDAMQSQLAIQRRLGVRVELLSPTEVKALVPEFRVADLAGGVFTPEDGYMDPYSVMWGYIRKAKSLGAEYVTGTVSRILLDEGGRVSGVQLSNGDEWRSPIVVNACGAWSAKLSETAGISLPVSPFRQQVFLVDLEEPVSTPLPLTVDVSGVYFRHEGTKVIAGYGKMGTFDEDYRWDSQLFHEYIWPPLAERSPNFERLRLERGWAGMYDYNTVDHNGIIGSVSGVPGYYVATGFSGHGLQHAPAVGKALSEAIRLGRYDTVDVTPLTPERFKTGLLVEEDFIV